MTNEQKLLEALKKLCIQIDDTGATPMDWQSYKYALAVIAEVEASQSEVEPVAWEIRQGKTDRVLLELTNNKERSHSFACSGLEVIPLYLASPTEPAIRELALREAMKVCEDEIKTWNEFKDYTGSMSRTVRRTIAALIPQPSALEEICMSVAELTAKHVQVYGSYDVDLQEIVTKVIAEWEGKK